GSRLKEQYLPEAHTDFILSIIGEELGLVGMICLIAGYFLIVFFGYRISMYSRSRQGMLLAGTLTSVFLFQVIINIGVVSGSLPTKGMSAPFISYGGSGMIVYVVIISLLLSVALDTAFPNYNKPVAEFFKKHLLARLSGRRES
ncbi:MAG: FtsW/RodA/SpoVE family cell cycle protein, partial [Victivallaceae bacterium]